MKNYKLFWLCIIPGMVIISTCKKVEKEMLVTTGTYSNLLTTTVDVTGEILDLGEGATMYGHSYATSPNPNISGPKTEYTSPAIGGFTSALTGLTPGTKYYIKAYLRRGNNVVYGSEINLTTASADLPELTTTTISGISKTGASSGGNITNQGGTPVISRGVCWNTATGPLISDNKTTNSSGTGTFTSTITGLTAGTKYYVRAYATNAGGTAYGDEVYFTTTSDAAVLPSVTTSAIASYTATSAVCGGEVTSEGSSSVTARGVCWSISIEPTIASDKSSDSNGAGIFVSNIENLEPGTRYYVRAYATNSTGTSYGNQLNFTTLVVKPTLTTLPISLLTDIAAKSGGYITSNGGASILDKGICWSTSTNPTIDNFILSGGIGSLGTYESILSNLLPKTKYFAKAYATNIAGTSYGNEVIFTTYSTPFCESMEATSVTTTTAILNGQVNAFNGPTTVTFEYGPSMSYGQTVTAIQSPVSGSTLTSVTATISGLIPSGQVYHYRIKASNDFGTVSGSDKLFSTSVADIAGNEYQTVIIGTQIWMKENLKTTKYNDDSDIGFPALISVWGSMTIGLYGYYNFDKATYNETYGALYNWYAVNSGKLCPSGWFVPGSSDIALLETYLGIENLGGKIKETGTTHWLTPNAGANNISGFTALPGGYLGSEFYYIGEAAYWWTSDEYYSGEAWFFGANYDYSGLNMYYFNKHSGLSIRCTKNQ